MDSFDFDAEIKDKTDINMIENGNGTSIQDNKGSETGVPSLDAFHEYQLWHNKNNSFDIIDKIIGNALMITKIEENNMGNNIKWNLEVQMLTLMSTLFYLLLAVKSVPLHMY